METLYFLGIALGGGALALFFSAGWSSFKHKKIPETGILFRWFVAGLVAAGLLAYAWIFGSGGDVGSMVNRIGDALDLENVMKLTATAGALGSLVGNVGNAGNAGNVEKEEESKREELQIGMPRF